MRIAEAQITLGVVCARSGDLDSALAIGRDALGGDRKSLPSFVMVSGELAEVANRRYPDEPEARDFLDELRALAA